MAMETERKDAAAILSVEHLSTSFFTSNGRVNAVRDVSFSLRQGEMLGIVGESGSGKTVSSLSILQLLGGSGRITDGKIIFDGTDLVSAPKKQLRNVRGARIAMVFQDPMSSLNPLMPVGRQIGEMIKTHQPKIKADELRSEVLRLLGLVHIPEPEKRYHSYPHEFSGGMRQRVMIAIALACKPDVLIADEPTTALDVTIQDQILKLLRSLRDEFQTSVIFITHDLGVVAELCSRVIVMYGGKIMEEALVDDLYENPAHPYTMGLLASVPNVAQDKQKRLQSIPGSPPDMIRPPAGCPFAPRCSYARNICGAQEAPRIQVGESHFSRCWLWVPEAPAENNPFRKAGGEA